MTKKSKLTELANGVKLSLLGKSTVGILFVGGLAPVIATAQESPAQESAGRDIEEVVVTGSRIARSELNTTTPVAVIDSSDYELSGTTNIDEFLNSMPQVLPGEGGFRNNEGTGVATIDLRGVGIQRSLVLVNGRRWIFFDARQVADLNTIPTALVAATELVTGGSSAVYGSDAVGGVINFVLKDDFEGVEASAQYDVSDRGDGAVVDFDLTMGSNFADGRGNAVVFMNYLRRESVLAADRPQSFFFYVDSVDENGNPVLVPGGSSSHPNSRISGFPTTGPALEARPAVQQALIGAGLGGITPFGFKFDDTGDGASVYVNPDDNYNFNPLNYLQLPMDRKMFGTMIDYDLTDRLEGYAELMFVNNRVETKRAPTSGGDFQLIQVDSPFLPPSVQNLFAALDATEGELQLDADGNPVIGPDGLPVLIPAPTRNDGYTSVDISRRLEEMGTRDNVFERNAFRALLGVRADLNDLGGLLDNAALDAYWSYARTRNVENFSGGVLDSAFTQGVTTEFDADGNLVCTFDPTGECVPINIFGPFISDEAVAFMNSSSTSSEEATMEVAAAVLTGNLFELPEGPMGIALGVEYRDMYGFFIPSTGGLGDIDAVPVGGSYTVKEVFGEALVPVLETVEVSAAFRYSDYTLGGIDGSWTYGTGLTWSPTDSITLRGNYQRAVRAPSIDELFVAAGTSAPAAQDPCALPSAATDPVIRELCIANGVPAFLVGNPAVQPSFQISDVTEGNLELREETADTYTFGVVLRSRFIDGLSATIDYWSIDIQDVIGRLGGTVNNVLDLCFNQIQDINSIYCQAIVRQPDGVIGGEDGGVFITNANVGRLETDGIDLRVNYGFDVGVGIFEGESRIDVSFGGTWVNSFDQTLVAELPNLVNECAGSFGLTCEEPRPEFKGLTRINWSDGPITASLVWSYLGSVTDDQVTLEGVPESELPVPVIDAVSYFDLTTSFLISDTYTVNVGVQNLFDKTQPIVGSSQEQLNTFPSTYDPFGRNFFLNATVRFD